MECIRPYLCECSRELDLIQALAELERLTSYKCNGIRDSDRAERLTVFECLIAYLLETLREAHICESFTGAAAGFRYLGDTLTEGDASQACTIIQQVVGSLAALSVETCRDICFLKAVASGEDICAYLAAILGDMYIF